MREKAAMMRVAIKNGITDLDSIKDSYNKYADGGGEDNILNLHSREPAAVDNTYVKKPEVFTPIKIKDKETEALKERLRATEEWKKQNSVNPEVYDIFEHPKVAAITKAKIKAYQLNNIPYIKDKEIMLSTGKYNTGKISTNVLDSIYASSQRTGVPIEIPMGIAGVESTLGIGYGFKEGYPISSTELVSNWQQFGINTSKISDVNKYTDIYHKYLRGEKLSDSEINFVKSREENNNNNLKNVESIRELKENPIDNAVRFFLKDKYNPGEKGYNNKVRREGELLMTDPAIKKWYNNKVNKKNLGGNLFLDGGDENIYYAGMLPNIDVYPINASLTTSYPLISKYYPFTGHSFLNIQSRYPNTESFSVTKKFKDKDYNLVTNNCANNTFDVLQAGKGIKDTPFLFTTPGNSKDYFNKYYEAQDKSKYKGSTKSIAPITLGEYERMYNKATRLKGASNYGKNSIYIK